MNLNLWCEKAISSTAEFSNNGKKIPEKGRDHIEWIYNNIVIGGTLGKLNVKIYE